MTVSRAQRRAETAAFIRSASRTAVRCRMDKQSSGPGGASTPRTLASMEVLTMTKRTCTIDGCAKPVVARGWCRPHYNRWWRHGDPLAGCTTPGAPRRFIDRAVAYSGTACLIWPYATHEDGYGLVQIGGRKRLAHRVVLEMVTGRSPRDMHAAHAPIICHNPACVAPSHLEWKSAAENAADKVLDGTDLRGERSPMSRLTESQVLEIYSDPRPQGDIASDNDIDRSTVSNIKRGRRWGWLTREGDR